METKKQSCDNCPKVPGKEKIFHCASSLSEEKFSYTWKIFNFDEIPFVSCYPIYSPTFYIHKTTNCVWQLAMTKHEYSSHRGESMDNEEGDISGSDDEDELECDGKKPKTVDIVQQEKTKRIGFRLLKLTENHIWDVVRYSFTVKTSDGSKFSTREREEPGLTGFRGVPLYTYLSEKDLGKLFSEKYLEVTCDINYSYVNGSTLETPVAYDGKLFSEDLRVLFVTNKFSDLLVTIDGEEHQAHRIVLDAAGLGKILESSDKPKTRFDLGLDSEVGKAMISFMYGGKIEDGFPLEKCIDLHEAARRYGIDCLEQYCSNYFKENLPTDICRKCIGTENDLEICLELFKRIPKESIKKLFSNEDCFHVSQSKQ